MENLQTVKVFHGNDDVLGKAAVILDELGKLLWTNGKKFQVVIECDPESGKMEMTRKEAISEYGKMGLRLYSEMFADKDVSEAYDTVYKPAYDALCIIERMGAKTIEDARHVLMYASNFSCQRDVAEKHIKAGHQA